MVSTEMVFAPGGMEAPVKEYPPLQATMSSTAANRLIIPRVFIDALFIFELPEEEACFLLDVVKDGDFGCQVGDGSHLADEGVDFFFEFEVHVMGVRFLLSVDSVIVVLPEVWDFVFHGA
jgi:hypothetical protein